MEAWWNTKCKGHEKRIDKRVFTEELRGAKRQVGLGPGVGTVLMVRRIRLRFLPRLFCCSGLIEYTGLRSRGHPLAAVARLVGLAEIFVAICAGVGREMPSDGGICVCARARRVLEHR